MKDLNPFDQEAEEIRDLLFNKYPARYSAARNEWERTLDQIQQLPTTSTER